MTASTAGRPDIRQALEATGAHYLNLVEIGILKTFVDYKVFDAIPDEGAISYPDLATKVAGEAELLERFCNYLVAAELLTSPTPGQVAHTDRSRAYRTGEIPAGFIVHVCNFFLRPVARWTEYFERNGLKEPKDARNIPLGLGTGHPDLDLYGILDAEPKLAHMFNRAQAGSASIYSLKGVYDFTWMEKELPKLNDGPAIVDVGGGSGLALKGILSDNTFLSAEKCAVFDFPKTIEQTKSQLDPALASVQLVGGSMLEPIPDTLRGALIYQFRRVLSDLLDKDIVLALTQVRASCTPDTRVLIIEELLKPNASKFTIAQDISVMNFGGKRRSESMFRELATQAQFRVNAVFNDESTDFGVLELLPV
ncbi:O-methyltransferase [Penicillium longicatenatum]|uniref:O-methyltransferase n=1 Tax=Penicillium longicatenatum TaxID=1561947 RepID=UPI0025485C5B|nr:O-methyltransferase [Penicillium longicatenatum]KAJ5630743.1 O-methyltransferase [Penicillium longicatenatum]